MCQGVTNGINNGSILLSVPESHAMGVCPGTNSPKQSAAIINYNLAISPVLFLLWQADVSAVKRVYVAKCNIQLAEAAVFWQR